MATAQTTPTATDDADVQFRAALDRLAMLITSGALLLVVGVYAATPLLAYSWTRIPFFGAFVEPPSPSTASARPTRRSAPITKVTSTEPTSPTA